MQYERDHAIPGKPVHLWLNTRDRDTKKLVTPDSVGNVEILKEHNGNTLLVETITPQLANPGTYLAIWSIPLAAQAGVYYDKWKDVSVSGGELSVFTERIIVVRPEIETNSPVLSQEYQFNLTTREILRDSISHLQFLLLKPKNDIFPRAQARIRNNQSQYTNRWVDLQTTNNEGFIKFDATSITLGQYFAQLKVFVGDLIFLSPEFSFTVRSL